MEKIVFEGKVELKVDSSDVISKDLEVFYNPEMALNRSLSVLIMNVLGFKDMSVCLPMAGTGVRALRFLKEVEESFISKIYVNDINPKMNYYLEHNLKLNDLEDKKLLISNLDSRKLFVEDYGFDYIDIDPFGSPNSLLDSAINRISGEGILAVTATDTAALAGTNPKTGLRKYWAKTFICPQKHEMSLRVLIRKIQLIGTQFNKALIPVLSYHYKHYYRIFFKIKRGKKICDELFNDFDEYFYDKKNGNFGLKKDLNEKFDDSFSFGGPIYTGKINDLDVLNKMLSFCEDEKIKSFLSKMIEESKIQMVGFFDLHDICSLNKIGSVNFENVRKELENNKFSFARCHTNQYGIKTDANFKDVVDILKCLKNKD